MAVVEKLGMTTVTGVNGVMLLWNALIGWFVAFVLPPTLHYSCCESCPRTTALGTASSSIGAESHNDGEQIDNEISVVSHNLDPVLVGEWASAVWWSLKLDVSNSLCSKELKHILFDDDPEINQNQTINILSNQPDYVETNITSKSEGDENGNEYGVETESTAWIVKGIPERPLYREVAKRLLQWNHQYCSQNTLPVINNNSSQTNHFNVMISAQELGFEEMSFSNGRTTLPESPPLSKNDIPNWLLSCRDYDKNADSTIYKLLGVRNTIGSLLPFEKRLKLLPSKRALMEAAGAFHEPKQKTSARHASERKQRTHQLLTVAAKARSKHAPRAIQEISFFGVARGPVLQQNQEAKALVQSLLENCVWINCHVFGGLTKTQTKDDKTIGEKIPSWVVEIRQEQGYGARWCVEECGRDIGKTHKSAYGSCSYPSATLIFRGFLEPQMEDGHERKWRH